MMRELPAYANRQVPSLEFRTNIVSKQLRDNYVNEYHRLKGYVSGYITTQSQADAINQRLKGLKGAYNDTYKKGISLYEDEFKKGKK